MEENKIKICVILGPTATKKSSLAIWLAEKIEGEIVSADSMQIYKEMNIATAKVSENEREKIPHHMIDFLDIEKEFSVADYVLMAKECINQIIKRGKKPILVGGTGLYIDCLLNQINFRKNTIDLNLRKNLEEELKLNGNQYMFKKLEKMDPNFAKKIHINNSKRIIRAIEILILTKKSIAENTELNNNSNKTYDSLKIGLNYKDRNKLYENIDFRVDEMMKNGLLKEAKNISSKNISKTAQQAIGYKEFEQYFKDEMNLEDAISNLKQNSRRYAKRQISWFKRDSNINWFFWDLYKESEIKDKILNLAKTFFN